MTNTTKTTKVEMNDEMLEQVNGGGSNIINIYNLSQALFSALKEANNQ